jgi:hypothetical protein
LRPSLLSCILLPDFAPALLYSGRDQQPGTIGVKE